ncbi:type 1 glutamine amidotransferase [Dactylosporangium sp. CA-052675]|uniref:type 1 glutamine amidotransferase n=1 Tax=Dactylosporangium sp. CA-052675 TaxID=3239927 RepID=UPI003D8F06AB
MTATVDHRATARLGGARRPLHVRQRCRLLFLNTQEQAPVREMGLPPYRDWIAEVTRLSPEQIHCVNVADGEALPDTIEAHGIIGGGSGHSSYEELPWIRRVKQFLAAAQRRGVPELHVCWSHQAKAEVAGAVSKVGHQGRRFGIETLTLTPEGRRDPLFRGLPDSFDVFTSHVDAVYDVPPVSEFGPVTELAYGVYRNEALAIGATARTLQIHPEMTSGVAAALAKVRRRQLIAEGHLGPSDLDYAAFLESLDWADRDIRARMRTLLDNWLRYYVAPAMSPPTAPALHV